MLNILFVDDEPNILEGLKRMSRSMRREWRMSFAGSGREALSMLAEEDFDIIVSDMKMPGMDGAELLKQTREHHPQIVRIVLSGFAETEMIMKSVEQAHQYLAKPCDPRTLKSTVQRASSLHGMLTNNNLRTLIAEMRTVPSLPSLYSELMDELNSPEPSLRKVGAIVKKDIGMTVKILQIVNSAFFGLRRHISDPAESVKYLGLETVSSLALAVGIFTQFENKIENKQMVSQLWAHSATVASTAKSIAEIENRKTSIDAFTSGLLHDIGEVILAINLPEEVAKIQELVAQNGMTKLEAERQVLGATHPDIGAYLLSTWGLPRAVVEAVAYHHDPCSYQHESFSALTAVHVADAFDEAKRFEPSEERGPEFDDQYLEKMGLAEKLPKWKEKCATCFDNEE